VQQGVRLFGAAHTISDAALQLMQRAAPLLESKQHCRHQRCLCPALVCATTATSTHPDAHADPAAQGAVRCRSCVWQRGAAEHPSRPDRCCRGCAELLLLCCLCLSNPAVPAPIHITIA